MKVRWGIDGTGGIARAMLAAIRAQGEGEVVAVASRSEERADAFAAEHRIPQSVVGSDALAALEVVDAVYVAGVNTEHESSAVVALEAGKAVLCEKPLAHSLESAKRIVEASRRSGSLLVEAMWMRFQPFWGPLEDMISVIGPVGYIRAELGIVADPDPARRWFDPAQGGGALLDVGIYPVTFSVALAGEPDTVAASGVTAASGVDSQISASMRHPSGVLSLIGASLVSDTDIEATVAGPGGRVRLESPFHHTARLTRWSKGEVVDTVDVPNQGFVHEVEEFHRCWRAGAIESRAHSHTDSLTVMRTLERVRAAAFRG